MNVEAVLPSVFVVRIAGEVRANGRLYIGRCDDIMTF